VGVQRKVIHQVTSDAVRVAGAFLKDATPTERTNDVIHPLHVRGELMDNSQLKEWILSACSKVVAERLDGRLDGACERFVDWKHSLNQ